MEPRLLAFLILLSGIILLLAWFFDSVGGAGFLYNLREIMVAVVIWAAVVTTCGSVVYLIAVVAQNDWTPKTYLF